MLPGSPHACAHLLGMYFDFQSNADTLQTVFAQTWSEREGGFLCGEKTEITSVEAIKESVYLYLHVYFLYFHFVFLEKNNHVWICPKIMGLFVCRVAKHIKVFHRC